MGSCEFGNKQLSGSNTGDFAFAMLNPEVMDPREVKDTNGAKSPVWTRDPASGCSSTCRPGHH